jgi:hypothetical protein
VLCVLYFEVLNTLKLSVTPFYSVKGPASNLRPSRKRPWMFIFIVPEETEASFTKQPFEEVWDSKVEQYVLGLSQKDVWER